MPFIRFAILVAFAGAAHAHATDSTRYLSLVNRAPDSVMSLSAAPAGTDAFAAIALAEPLRGGDAATVEIAGGDCRYDVRATFRDGREAVYRGVDACRKGGLYIERLPR
ncbi:MAG TPA: hypothetical protein VJ724_08760 [Tahibacter sp.]|nr:hypothetical protein [Tahibacter sp.]